LPHRFGQHRLLHRADVVVAQSSGGVGDGADADHVDVAGGQCCQGGGQAGGHGVGEVDAAHCGDRCPAQRSGDLVGGDIRGGQREGGEPRLGDPPRGAALQLGEKHQLLSIAGGLLPLQLDQPVDHRPVVDQVRIGLAPGLPEPGLDAGQHRIDTGGEQRPIHPWLSRIIEHVFYSTCALRER